ncbi:MAG: P22 coat - protein 5 family protein [Pseudomonadota bacterium]|nr:P22 coat - protein 5 family protein [Pseudomonadota bacterium]
MANTLTGLIPTLYEALDTVSREMVGFIPAVSRDTSSARAALNETILVPITTGQVANDNIAGVTAPNTGDQTITSIAMTIAKSKHVPIRWGGEEQRGMGNAGTYNGVLLNQFTQGFRTLTNLIEIDLFNAAISNASRAYGIAGTAPFGTPGNLSDIAQVRKILTDNGTSTSELQYVGSTAAFANLRGVQSVLFKVSEAGTSDLLRNGVLGRLEGFDLHESAAVTMQTKGSGSGYTTTSAGSAAGSTQIALVSGTGTVNPGDVVTFAGDVNQYVVQLGISAPGTISIGAPGLVQAIPAAATAMSIGANRTPNVAFARSAIQLITRAPQMPVGPDGVAMDMADDVVQVTDPVSGITFDIAVYRQFMQMVYHVRVAWGAAAIKPEHTVLSLG